MNTYLRTWALDDIHISRSGDGRTVTAYAAMFDAPYEVRDQHGHYMESIERSAFNRTLRNGGAGKVACLFNHGLTVHGTPDMLGSVPLGTPLEIKPDGRGLLTVTRYNKSDLAEATLEAIRNGDIRSQSFRGRIFRSSPDRVPRAMRGGNLPTVTRHELGLSDYGPTPVPVNAGAEIVAVRSASQIVEELEHLDDDAREELLEELARHLRGKHSQSSHGNRFHTPGDRGSGLRRKGVSKLDHGGGDRKDDSGKGDAKTAARTFTNQELSDILDGKRGTVTEHRRALEEAGATREQSAKILKDLGVQVARDDEVPDTFGRSSDDKTIADFNNGGARTTLHQRVAEEKQAEAEAKQRAALREATPAAYDKLLGAGGESPLLKSKQQRAVFEAMRERGWVMTGVGRGDVTVWSSPDGGERIELSLSQRLGNKVGGFEGEREQSEPLTWGKALERVTGGPAAAPSPAEMLAGPTGTPNAGGGGRKAPGGYEVGRRVEVLTTNFDKPGFPEEWMTGTVAEINPRGDRGHVDLGIRLEGKKDKNGDPLWHREIIGPRGGNKRIREAASQGKSASDGSKPVVDDGRLDPGVAKRRAEQIKLGDQVYGESEGAMFRVLFPEEYGSGKVPTVATVGRRTDSDGRKRVTIGFTNGKKAEFLEGTTLRISPKTTEVRRATDDFPAPDEAPYGLSATPADAGPGAEDSHPQAVHSGRLSIRRNRIRAELISLGVIKP